MACWTKECHHTHKYKPVHTTKQLEVLRLSLRVMLANLSFHKVSKCGSYHFAMGRQEQTPVAPIQQEEKNPSAWCKSPNVYVSTIKNRTLCEGTSRTENTRVRLWGDYTD